MTEPGERRRPSQPAAGQTPVEPADARRRDAEARRALRPSVDELGEASFPASDPPAVWTWDTDPR